MKKFYSFVLLALLIPVISSSQTYTPLLDSVNIWHYTATPMLVRLQDPNTVVSTPCTYPSYFFASKMQYTTHDTVIDSLSYKIVEELTDQNPNYCELGYVREDTAAHKVYFKDNLGNPEIVLYNFGLQVGDTMTINFLSGFGLYTSGVFQLDSISVIQTQQGPERLFCLNNHAQSFGPTLYWAEGVGCLVNMFYPYGMNQYASNSMFWNCRDYPQFSYEYLSCFDHVAKVYYDSCKYTNALNDFCFLTTDTCNYWNICGSVADHSVDFSFDLFPIPASDCITLQLMESSHSRFDCTITDIAGKVVYTSSTVLFEGNRASIDISRLTKGTYLLTLSNDSGATSKTLTIQ